MANASHKNIGSNPRQSQHGARGAGADAPGEQLDEFDIASDIQGKKSLQGEDQERRLNERQAQAEGDGETDGLIESFEKTDKKTRAESEQNRGNGKGR